MFARAGVGILVSPHLADSVIEWNPVGERVALIRLRLERVGVLTVVQVYGPNSESEYDAFLEVDGTLERIPRGDRVVLMGDFNARVGRDVEWCDRSLWGSHTERERQEAAGLLFRQRR